MEYMKNKVRKSAVFILRALYTLPCLLWVSLFFFRFWKTIARNSIIFPFWTWSFGHTAAGVDFYRRTYYPQRVTLIYIPHIRSNRFMLETINDNMDIINYYPLFKKFSNHLSVIDCNLIYIFLVIINVFSGRWTIVGSLSDLYKIGRQTDFLLEGNFGGKGTRPGANMTGYMRLLKENRGGAGYFPEDKKREIERQIKRLNTDFNGRFVTLHLRHRAEKHWVDESTKIRDVDDQARYLDAIKLLERLGYFIMGTGETDHDIFKQLSHYIDVPLIDAPAEMKNIYALSQCAFFIGNQSGPHVVPNIFEKPCLIMDALPYNLGTFHERDLIHFKHLYRVDGQRLSLEEIYGSEMLFCNDLSSQGIRIIEVPSEEITDAVREMSDFVEGASTISAEDKELISWFRSLLNPRLSIFHAGNRCPVAFLRKIREITPVK